MRHLLYFTLGFTLSCAVLSYRIPRYFAVFPAVILLILCLLWRRTGNPVKVALCILLGCSVGLCWFQKYEELYLRDVASLDGSVQAVNLRVTDYSEETNYGIRFDGMLRINGKPYRVIVYMNDMEPLAPGNTVTGPFRFRITTPEGTKESVYHQGKGIFLLAYQDGDAEVLRNSPGKWDIPAVLRHKIRSVLVRHFPEDTAPFAKALLIGDTSDISYETDTDFKVSGIRHVIAVSGLHVSILFGLLSTVTLKKRWLTALVGFPSLFLFAAIAGFTPSVSRSCIMCALMLLAMLAEQEYDGPTALSFAVLVILFVNPLAITSVSLQLSAGSVAGIYLFDGDIRKWLLSLFGELNEGRVRRFFVKWFCASVSITLSAMTITTPLCAYYFGMVSLVGPLTNLLALWVISFIFYGIMGVCLLHLLLPAAAAVFAQWISLPIRYVLFVAKTMADIPLAAVYTVSPYITAWLFFVYILLILFLISKNRKPVTLSCCAALGLCIALLAGWLEPMQDAIRLTVLDVGQGQCLLFQAEGRSFLVDCGGDSDTQSADMAAETLLSQGIPKLDGLILTHLDRDHAGGAVNLLSRLDTDLLVLPPVHSNLEDSTSGHTIYASEPLALALGETNIKIYPPTFPGNSNEMSLCILFDTKNCDILVTGDRNGFGERSLLRSADIPDVDILVAGHHGSKHSTCEELLAAVRPEIVCISAGRDNSYGHPAPETLERLQTYGCTVYRTDQLGSFTIRR